MNISLVNPKSHLSLGVLLSVVLHAGLFLLSAVFFNSAFQHSNYLHISDLHLPVSVELVRSLSATGSVLSPTNQITHSMRLSTDSQTRTDENRYLNQVRDRVLTESPLKPPSIKVLTDSKNAWNRAPVYPELARQRGQEGRVILEANLSGVGKVISVRVAHSSGFSQLDHAALIAARDWTLELPANGSRRLFIPITFELKSSS